MDIKKLGNTILIFTINRLIEILGIFIFCLGILVFISLVSYSPSDPNFIFPENTEIKNILGVQGSYIADFFIQSSGLISFLIPITILITGINIFRNKEIFLIIENLFFASTYTLFGSFFFSLYHKDSFTYYINGNGGFIGNYLNETFLSDLAKSNETIFYYILLFVIILLFLISMNLTYKSFTNFIKKF